MIQINLAARKQVAASAAVTAPAGPQDLKSLFSNMKSLKLDFSTLQEILPWKKLLLAGGLIYAATAVDGALRAKKLGAVNAQLQAQEEVKRQIEAELAKTKGYEAIKRQLDQDDAVIRAKLTAIRILMEGRKDGPRMLFALSAATPKNVWIQSLGVEKTGVTLAGRTTEFSEVSDFLRKLNETAFFRDLVLVSSEKEGSLAGKELTRFEFSGKKR